MPHFPNFLKTTVETSMTGSSQQQRGTVDEMPHQASRGHILMLAGNPIFPLPQYMHNHPPASTGDRFLLLPWLSETVNSGESFTYHCFTQTIQNNFLCATLFALTNCKQVQKGTIWRAANRQTKPDEIGMRLGEFVNHGYLKLSPQIWGQGLHT